MEIFSYDDESADRSVELQSDKSRIKKCRSCGKLFVTGLGRYACRRKDCFRVHYMICPICGAEYVIEGNLKEPKQACSAECRGKLMHLHQVETMRRKYGVDNPSQHPEIHAKAVKSINQKKDQISQHLQQTMKEKYGGMGTASPVLRTKIEKTIQEKYGVTNVSELPEIRQKISDAHKSEECISKYKATSKSHYGTDYPAQSEEVQYMMRKTCMERYGVEYVGSLSDVIEKRKDTVLEKYGCTNTLLLPEAREKARLTMLANCTGRVSKLNKRFGEFLASNNIQYEFEFYLGKKWYDVHLLNTNIVIEIDPSYTHSTVPSHWTSEGLDTRYHLSRTQIAETNKYRCIHIFDWDNWDNLLSILKQPDMTVGARKCELRSTAKHEYEEFLQVNHIQGTVKGTSEAYGLYYNNQLIQLMTFGKPRYTSKYDFELLRLCTLSNYAISGGAERLFTHFVKQHQNSSIISYCDLSKFTGDVYERMGFTLDHISPPARVWSKENKKITDNLLRQRGYDQLFGTNYGKGTSNEELMLENGWLPVYDCGQKVFTYFPKYSENSINLTPTPDSI